MYTVAFIIEGQVTELECGSLCEVKDISAVAKKEDAHTFSLIHNATGNAVNVIDFVSITTQAA